MVTQERKAQVRPAGWLAAVAVVMMRQRPGTWVIIAVAAGVLWSVTVALVLFGDSDSWSAWQSAGVAIPGIAGVVIAVGGVSWLRRHRPGPSKLGSRADEQTRREVRDALRTGGAADARIDDLARDSARRTLGDTWQPLLAALMVILQAEIIVFRLSVDRSDLLGLVVSPLLLVLLASSLWSLVVARRRSRRYLDRQPGEGAPAGRAAGAA